MIASPKDNALKLSNYLNQMVGEIQTPQQLQATKQYLMHLTNNDPQIKANNLQFVPLGVANSLVNHPMNQPDQSTTKDKIEGQLMASNTQPPGIQNVPPQQPGQAPQLNAPPQPPQVGNSGIAALPQSGGVKMARGGVISMATGGNTFDALLSKFIGKSENAEFQAPTDPRQIEKQVAAERPDLGAALNRPVGQSLNNLLDQVAKERESQYAEQTGPEAKRREQLRISNALLQAAEGTRGMGNNLAGIMSGVAAGAGYSNKAIADEMERVNTLKSKKMEANLADAKLKDLIEERQLAAANGEVAKVIAFDKEIKNLQNEKTKLGISSLGNALAPLASVEHARISAAAQLGAQDRPTDFIKDAKELMRNNPKLTFEEAYKMAGMNRGAGAQISANERLQAKYIDALNKIKERYPTLQYYDPNKRNPALDSAYANYMKEVQELQNQMKADGVGMPSAPAATTGNVIKFDAKGNIIG
jgi:hypothetical protein